MNILKVLIATVAILFVAGIASAQLLTPKETLGKEIFFDTNLSVPGGQSCASCHAPETGFTGPLSSVNATTVVYPGAVATRFGNRKPPTAAYGGQSPVFSGVTEEHELLFVGGMFWDGRATGWELGDPLAEQARGPFLNPLEQNNPSKDDVVRKIRGSNYASLFEQVYGVDVWNNIDDAYNKSAEAIASYERSAEVNPFTSKFDYYLRGMVRLSKEEQQGLHLFRSKGKCDNCHISKTGPRREPPLFTDFTFDNLGIPKNPDNPFYTMSPEFNPAGTNWVDPGLGGFLATTSYNQYASENDGKQKVPSLRNVDKRPSADFVKAYGHNGYFKSLKEIVHFYNTRDVEVWPPPEVSSTVNTSELGSLSLSSNEEDAIVAFLKTLSDGFVPPVRNGTLSMVSTAPPTSGSLQILPNPFNPETEIRFEIPYSGNVELRLFNTLGQEVRVLAEGTFDAGWHSVRWDGLTNGGSSAPSGIYIATLTGASVRATVKLMLIR